MLEGEVNKQIRRFQSLLLTQSDGNVSFSSTLNALLTYAISTKPETKTIKKIAEQLKR